MFKSIFTRAAATVEAVETVEALQAAIAAKAAAYKAAGTKANFGLPVQQTGYCFATKAQAEQLADSGYTFENVHPKIQ